MPRDRRRPLSDVDWLDVTSPRVRYALIRSGARTPDDVRRLGRTYFEAQRGIGTTTLHAIGEAIGGWEKP
jgi:hypothetical protein